MESLDKSSFIIVLKHCYYTILKEIPTILNFLLNIMKLYLYTLYIYVVYTSYIIQINGLWYILDITERLCYLI